MKQLESIVLPDGTEIRKWLCEDCGGEFYVNCDDADYPNYCPHCGKEKQ